MSTLQSIGLARTPSKRRSAMRRQAKRRRECQRYGCPTHTEQESPESIAAWVRREMAIYLAGAKPKPR